METRASSINVTQRRQLTSISTESYQRVKSDLTPGCAAKVKQNPRQALHPTVIILITKKSMPSWYSIFRLLECRKRSWSDIKTVSEGKHAMGQRSGTHSYGRK